MTLVLLPNNVWHDAAQITVTDASNVATGDTAGLENVIGGPRSLAWSSSDSGARRIVLVNKAGGLGCSHVVLARADRHAGKSVSVLSWSNYPSASNTEFSSASFSATLVGPRAQDWVLPLALSGKQAIGLSLNSADYTKDVYKLFVSNGLSFVHHTAPSFQILPFPSRHQYRRQTFLVDTEWNFFVEQLTRAEVDAFEAIPNLLSEPMFVYDPDGHSIYHKNLHGIVTAYQTLAAFDDLYQLSFTVRELRQWP
ncbi:hypothetical protein EP7_004280 [Isosphaeraceae bacterium EP7]